jgi:hypothetical protein
MGQMGNAKNDRNGHKMEKGSKNGNPLLFLMNGPSGNFGMAVAWAKDGE